MADKKSNPLFIHAIILFVLGGALVIYGSIDLIGQFKARDVMYADQKGRAQTGMARSLTRAPRIRRGGNPLTAARDIGRQGKRFVYILKRFSRYGPSLLLGIGAIVIGIFVLKRKNWARYVSFVILGTAVLIFIGMMAMKMGAGGGVALPLIAIIMFTAAGAKLEWDFMVEKFDPAPA